VLAPIYDVLRGTHTTRCLSELERSQWWPQERIEELQSEKLRLLMEHAYRTVPHYRSVMQERRLTPADIRSAADLPALPMLTRPEVQAHGADLLSEGFPRGLLRPTKTSGSTGTPLLFYGTTDDQLNHGFARGIRAQEMTGLHLGDRMVSLGRPRLYTSSHERVLRGLGTRFRRKFTIPVDRLTTDGMPGILQELNDAHPDGIGGYPNAVALVAAFIRDTGAIAPSVRTIVTGGAELLEHDRRLIREVFSLEPYSNYSAYEAFGIACECETHTGLHISAEDVVLEVVDENGTPLSAGAEGRIVVTNLHNFGMPFVRYDLGDTGSLLSGDCPCGRTLPRLGLLIGRKSRFFVTRSGRRIFSGTLYLDRLAGLGMRQYQVIQEDLDNVVMKLVPSPEQSNTLATLETKVRDMFEARFGHEIALHVEFVSRIEPTEAGKHVFMLSIVTDADLT
jgi:phenylacetate-CoA ligase